MRFRLLTGAVTGWFLGGAVGAALGADANGQLLWCLGAFAAAGIARRLGKSHLVAVLALIFLGLFAALGSWMPNGELAALGASTVLLYLGDDRPTVGFWFVFGGLIGALGAAIWCPEHQLCLTCVFLLFLYPISGGASERKFRTFSGVAVGLALGAALFFLPRWQLPRPTPQVWQLRPALPILPLLPPNSAAANTLLVADPAPAAVRNLPGQSLLWRTAVRLPAWTQWRQPDQFAAVAAVKVLSRLQLANTWRQVAPDGVLVLPTSALSQAPATFKYFALLPYARNFAALSRTDFPAVTPEELEANWRRIRPSDAESLVPDGVIAALYDDDLPTVRGQRRVLSVPSGCGIGLAATLAALFLAVKFLLTRKSAANAFRWQGFELGLALVLTAQLLCRLPYFPLLALLTLLPAYLLRPIGRPAGRRHLFTAAALATGLVVLGIPYAAPVLFHLGKCLADRWIRLAPSRARNWTFPALGMLTAALGFAALAKHGAALIVPDAWLGIAALIFLFPTLIGSGLAPVRRQLDKDATP